MNGTCPWLWMCIALLLVLPARAQEVATPEPQAYRAVMAAQYAARQQPIPARPEEAQKIYDDYLRSIGRPIKERPEEPQENMTTPSH